MVSLGHAAGTSGSGVVSCAAYVMGMSVVRGMRRVFLWSQHNDGKA